MDSGVKKFIEEITQNINVEISVYDEKGENVFGTHRDGEHFPTEFDGIVSDVVLNRTLFRIKYKNKNYIAKINGAGKAERNYAFLVSELTEKAFSKDALLTKEEFYKAVLLGEINYFQLGKYMRKFMLVDRPASVMVIYSDKDRIPEIVNILNNYSEFIQDFVVSLDEKQCAFVKFSDESTGEYRSFTEYAQFLSQTIYEETGIIPGIFVGGTVQTIAELPTSFLQALSSQRLAGQMNAQKGVHSFKEYIFVKMLEDLPKYKLNEYLTLLLDSSAKEIFEDEEMISTADEFLENSLNVSETSRKLYLHRNTLNYRLDKIEKATGLNIRKFSEAVTFRIISILSKTTR